jgi:hypothetical protein
MAKLTTINYDETGREVVTLSNMPERPDTATAKTPAINRVPSSPHKPFTSRNFYDLTNTTPENPKSELSSEKALQGAKVFMMPPSMDDDIIVIPGPFARDAQGRKVSVQKENTPNLMQGESKGASSNLLIQLHISLIQRYYFPLTRLSGSHRKWTFVNQVGILCFRQTRRIHRTQEVPRFRHRPELAYPVQRRGTRPTEPIQPLLLSPKIHHVQHSRQHSSIPKQSAFHHTKNQCPQNKKKKP